VFVEKSDIKKVNEKYKLNHLNLNNQEWGEILEQCDPNNYGKIDYY